MDGEGTCLCVQGKVGIEAEVESRLILLHSQPLLSLGCQGVCLCVHTRS